MAAQNSEPGGVDSAAALSSGPGAALGWPAAVPISSAALVHAFAEQKRVGYRLDRIGHAARMQTGVLLQLAAQAAAADTQRRPFFIDHRLYAAAYREVTGLATEQLPSFVRAAAEAKEDIWVNYRTEAVIEGAAPPGLLRALNVKVGWPASAQAPTHYDYLDTNSKPHVETRRERVGSWRVLDYGHSIVQDEIEGLSGRARGGLLGALFSVIGSAKVVHSRYMPLPGGELLVHTTVRSGVAVSRSALVTPSGEVQPVLPPERGDLQALEAQLLGLKLPERYRPMG